MQKHLLSKSDLTLKWALEIAQSQEAAARNTQQLKYAVSSMQNAIIAVTRTHCPRLPLKRGSI